MLRELLGKGQPVKVTIKVASEMRTGLKTASVLGTLPGTTDEEVIVMAHIDGYFDGAIDNASGVAVMMGSARALRESAAGTTPPQHPLHGFGRPSRRPRRQLAARQHAKPSWPKTVLMINLEHVAAVRTEYWGIQLRMTHRSVADALVGVGQQEPAGHVALTSFSHFNVGITADMDTGRLRRNGRGRPRCALDPGHHVAGAEAYRAGRSRVGARPTDSSRSRARTRESSTK